MHKWSKKKSNSIQSTLLAFTLSLTILTGCGVIPEPIAAMLGAGDKPAIDVDAQVGKTNQIDESLISVKGQTQTADAITNTETTQAETIENISVPWWTLIVAVFTGILVMPIELVRGWRMMKRDTQ
jgi:hypothetical protein